MSDDEIQFFSPEIRPELEPTMGDVTVSVTVAHSSSLRIGKFLDIIDSVADAMNLDVTVTVPGYRRVFYGWEKDVWSPGE